jgi:arsenite methyltransferase
MMTEEGGGIDCLLSAKRVGDRGKVYGLDMTESMISLAQKNVAEAGVTNIEFLHGNMESIPLPDNAVDVIISNCVINLAADKDIVLREAYRVLKKGGQFAVSDIVLRKELPENVTKDVAMWTGCVAGALVKEEYISKLKGAGFVEASVEEVRVYTASDVPSSSVLLTSFRSRNCRGGRIAGVGQKQTGVSVRKK